MAGLDLDAAAREAEELRKRLEDLLRQADQVQRDLRRAAEEQASQAMHTLRQPGDLAGRIDELAKQAEQVQRDLRRVAEAQAEHAVRSFVQAEKQAEALALVHRAFRILDEVGSWMGAQGYVGLAAKLQPELRAGYDELQAFLKPAPPDLGVTR